MAATVLVASLDVAAARPRDCEDEGSMDAVRACIADKDERDLARAQAAFEKRIRAQPGVLDAARREQAEWRRYVDMHCDLLARLETAGYPDDARLECQADALRARVSELAGMAKASR